MARGRKNYAGKYVHSQWQGTAYHPIVPPSGVVPEQSWASALQQTGQVGGDTLLDDNSQTPTILHARIS
jgi:hypothetical protein